MNNKIYPLSLISLRIRRAVHRYFSSYNDEVFSKKNCPVCGSNSGMIRKGVLWPDLVFQWQLTPAWANWIDQREGLQCIECKCNLRSQQIAECISEIMNNRLGIRASSFSELCSKKEMQSLVVAETNAAGNLHQQLSKLKRLYYSEYGSTDPSVPSEDLQNLSYDDNYFDLIINSDVLEHVPNVELALSEIIRVLKNDGHYIFSVPVVWIQNQSRTRAKIENNRILHLAPPSFHGNEGSERNDFLVFHEFGTDFVQVCKEVGFSLELRKSPNNPSLVTFIATKNRNRLEQKSLNR